MRFVLTRSLQPVLHGLSDVKGQPTVAPAVGDEARAQVSGTVAQAPVELQPLLPAGGHVGVLDQEPQFSQREQPISAQARPHLTDVEQHLLLRAILTCGEQEKEQAGKERKSERDFSLAIFYSIVFI